MSSEIEELSSESQAPEQEKESFNLKSFLRKNATQLGMIFVFFGIWLFFIFAAPDTFLSPQIYYAFMATTPFFAIRLPIIELPVSSSLRLADDMPASDTCASCAA